MKPESDDRTGELMLTAFAVLWLDCLQAYRRKSGGCRGCWQAVRFRASQVPSCDLARAVLALPERGAATFEDGPGLRWVETHADDLLAVARAVESSLLAFGLDSVMTATEAICRAANDSMKPASDNRAEVRTRQAKPVRWNGNGNRGLATAKRSPS